MLLEFLDGNNIYNNGFAPEEAEMNQKGCEGHKGSLTMLGWFEWLGKPAYVKPCIQVILSFLGFKNALRGVDRALRRK